MTTAEALEITARDWDGAGDDDDLTSDELAYALETETIRIAVLALGDRVDG